MDRKSSFDEVIKKSKESPGVGKYEAQAYYNKRIRPPKGTYKQKQDRITLLDEAIFTSKQIPFDYNAPRLDSIKKRPYQ